MKTIGEELRKLRLQKKISLKKLQLETKIKKNFIKAIEESNWSALPEFPVVTGFVKNLASYFNLDTKKAVALLRRDYPAKKKVNLNPKPDLKKPFTWGPRLTFLLGFAIISIIIAIYLLFQLNIFTKNPNLVINTPKNKETIFIYSEEENLKITGQTSKSAAVTVNNQPALVNDDGKFETEIIITPETSNLEVTAKTRSGKSTVANIEINVKLEK